MSELFERKWQVFGKRVRVFRYVPFVEFVLLAGSMATGKVHEGSDFDVMLGVRAGRVWMSWLFSLLPLHVLRYRAHYGIDKTDRINISHVASPGGYRLSPPYDAYWQRLYKHLVPALGDEEKMQAFFKANDWMEPRRRYETHPRYLGGAHSFPKRVLESMLGGRLGDMLEQYFIRRYSSQVGDPKKLGYKPRLVYNDERLEMYRDTRRIEEMISRGEV